LPNPVAVFLAVSSEAKGNIVLAVTVTVITSRIRTLATRHWACFRDFLTFGYLGANLIDSRWFLPNPVAIFLAVSSEAKGNIVLASATILNNET